MIKFPGGTSDETTAGNPIERGKRTMLVKAKWNVKDSGGWHKAGDVFNTEADLGDAVEALETVPKPAAKPETEPEGVQETAPKAETEAARTKPKAQRRKSR